MKKMYTISLLAMLSVFTGWSQGALQPFTDDVEWHDDFAEDNMVGWTSLDLDGDDTAGPFQTFPGEGGPLGFIVYTPSQTDPPNVLDSYVPHSGEKYFASISSWDGPANDWLISDELAAHPGGTFSFYAKSTVTFAGDDEFKVGYSTTGSNPEDFIFLNDGNTTIPTEVWNNYTFEIPADAKHLAINCVSYAFMMLVDDISFVANIDPQAPGLITDFSSGSELGEEITATFSWVNPTIDDAGNALGDMTGVKVYRGTHPMNLTEVADLPSGAGETMTYADLLPEGGSYTYRFVAYNDFGNGAVYNTPVTFFGYETIPGAPVGITFTQNENLQTVITWDEVDYGEMGGTLENPVVGYTITRSLGTTSETLATMHSSTSYTETDIPDFNLYTYNIVAQTSPENMGAPAVISAYSGLGENQVPVTSGNEPSDQPFELSRPSIISQSIYTPEEMGTTSGLITTLSYFANLGTTSTANYKIYMSMSDRENFGTTLGNAVWEYFGDQELLFDGQIQFPVGRNAITIDLDQPFYYDASSNDNVIITIVKPLLENPPSVNPREFYNTPVEGMRTYFTNGYTVDLSVITTQPASWTTTEIPGIPSIVVDKRTDYGSLDGVVTLLADDSPLDEVTVTITPEGLETYQMVTTTTDETGAYYIPALLPGTYSVSFSKDTYNTFETSIVIEAEQAHELDATLDNSIPTIISGTVVDAAGNAIEGVNLNLTGFSNFAAMSDATGNFALEAFGDKAYNLEITHPLYITQSISFTSEEGDYTLDPVTMVLALHKPTNVVAVNNDGVGELTWNAPLGFYNESMLGWGSFITAGDAWGNGGDPFISAVRLEPADLELQVEEGAALTHVRAYIANFAEVIIKVFKGDNAGELIHSQPASVSEEGWYVFELTNPIPIDMTDELWIGVEFLAGAYGAYPIGLDDGPNAPGQKGSMKYENGSWVQMSLTNKNWNIYGIANNIMEANPLGYKVYRSPASANDWTELTTESVPTTSYSDVTLGDAAPGFYAYGIAADYGDELISEKAISNEIDHNMFFDYTVEIDIDFGSAEGAYVSVWNEDNFAEAFIPAAATSVTFQGLLTGTYNVRVERDNYEIQVLTDVAVEEQGTITVPLNLLKVQPSNLTATAVEGTSSYTLDWTLHTAFTDQIEKYADFERENIGDYILQDMDGFETYTYDNFTWPDAGAPMSYMVFNPYSTTPAVDIDSYSGRRFLTAFAGPDGVNNDWLIIPAGEGVFSFMAASLVGTAPENMQVLYSTTGTEVTDFTAFEGEITVPATWTEYAFDAPAGTKYVAINYVGNDTYILRIDDLTYEKEYHHALSYNIYLNGELVSQNVDETSFVLEDLPAGNHIAEVEAVYETGVSEKTEVQIGTVNVEDHAKAEFKMYPNPTRGIFTLELESRATVSVIDMRGRILYKSIEQMGTSVMEHSLASGTYIIQVKTQEGTTSKKLIVM